MSRENQMNNVGVFEMAERREKRAAEQQDMLARCGLPLVCINMNIAGPVKRGALIDWAFFRALNAAANSFKGKIRGFAFTNEKTGIEAMLAVDAAAESLKKQAESIEKDFPEGRLFDIDVICTDGLKLSRNVPRKCLICGQPAAACARSRTHSAEELRKATAELLKRRLRSIIPNLRRRHLSARFTQRRNPDLLTKTTAAQTTIWMPHCLSSARKLSNLFCADGKNCA